MRECVQHRLVSAHRGHDAQLYLGIVGRDENVVRVPRDDCGTDHLATFRAHRDVLQVRIG